MKNLLQLILFAIFGLFSSVHAETLAGKKSDFTWSDNQEYKVLDKVRFVNGDFIEVAEGKVLGRQLKENCELQRLEVKRETPRSLLFVSSACDSIVHIRAAYPDAKNAKLAIVTTNCGGTICHGFSEYFIAFIGEPGIRITKIGTSFIGPKNKSTKYEFGFDGQKLSTGLVSNFYDGSENGLGDLIASTRIFIKQGYFVDPRFNKKFLNLVGEHPDVAMGDRAVRSLLVSKIKPERFRAFRSAMSGPGSSGVQNGRFLVMNACMKSNCPFEFGSVVIDGFTGAMHVLRFNPDENIFDYASSHSVNEKIDDEWLEAIDTQEKYQLSIKNGRIRAKKN
jgi:hypothetical protein